MGPLRPLGGVVIAA